MRYLWNATLPDRMLDTPKQRAMYAQATQVGYLFIPKTRGNGCLLDLYAEWCRVQGQPFIIVRPRTNVSTQIDVETTGCSPAVQDALRITALQYSTVRGYVRIYRAEQTFDLRAPRIRRADAEACAAAIRAIVLHDDCHTADIDVGVFKPFIESLESLYE